MAITGNATTDQIDQTATRAGTIVSKLLGTGCEAKMVAWLEPLEDDAARQQAKTARAALFQLLVAAADLGELAGTTDWEPEALAERIERIEACVISALNVFERECNLDRNELGGAYFARRNYIPQAWQKSAAA